MARRTSRQQGNTKSVHRRLAQRPCHPECNEACPACASAAGTGELVEGGLSERPVLSFIEGFFAALRMTGPRGPNVLCTKLLWFDLDPQTVVFPFTHLPISYSLPLFLTLCEQETTISP
jgi:hypothetical protein